MTGTGTQWETFPLETPSRTLLATLISAGLTLSSVSHAMAAEIRFTGTVTEISELPGSVGLFSRNGISIGSPILGSLGVESVSPSRLSEQGVMYESAGRASARIGALTFASDRFEDPQHGVLWHNLWIRNDCVACTEFSDHQGDLLVVDVGAFTSVEPSEFYNVIWYVYLQDSTSSVFASSAFPEPFPTHDAFDVREFAFAALNTSNDQMLLLRGRIDTLSVVDEPGVPELLCFTLAGWARLITRRRGAATG